MERKQRQKKKITWDSRRRMLLALGIEILIYGVFAAAIFFVLLAGYALSTVHDPNDHMDMALLSVLWPLLELVLSWMWLALSTTRYAESKYKTLGNSLALTASTLAPILGYVFIKSDVMVLSSVMIGIPLLGHWTARLLWLTRETMPDHQVVGNPIE